MTRTNAVRRGVGACLLLCGVFWAGTALGPQGVTAAGPRDAVPPGHFLDGSERALPILEEISATLKQIDARLAAIEKSVAAKENPQPAASQVPQ